MKGRERGMYWKWEERAMRAGIGGKLGREGSGVWEENGVGGRCVGECRG